MHTTDLRKRALKTQKGGKKRVAEALIKLICIHINPFKIILRYLGNNSELFGQNHPVP